MALFPQFPYCNLNPELLWNQLYGLKYPPSVKLIGSVLCNQRVIPHIEIGHNISMTFRIIGNHNCEAGVVGVYHESNFYKSWTKFDIYRHFRNFITLRRVTDDKQYYLYHIPADIKKLLDNFMLNIPIWPVI